MDIIAMAVALAACLAFSVGLAYLGLLGFLALIKTSEENKDDEI